MIHKLPVNRYFMFFFILLTFPVYSFSQKVVYDFDEKVKIISPYSPPNKLVHSSPASMDEHGVWKTEFSVPGIVGKIQSTSSDNSNLYLGGNFKVAGSITANNIVRWDGEQWHSIGDGSENGVSSDSATIPNVLAIVSYNGKIFVGGQFSLAGSVSVNGIACWDGEKWNSLGEGNNNGVRNLSFNGKDTVAYPGTVHSLFLHKDKLYVGGSFHRAGNQVANGVAIWDIKKQQWETMKGGLGSNKDHLSAYGYGFTQINDIIYVAGKFDQAGDQSANNFARWDGTKWQGLSALKEHLIDLKSDKKGRIFAVGYRREDDSSGLSCLQMWDGKVWQSLPGPEGYRTTATRINLVNDELFVSGVFERPDSSKASLAIWNENGWKVIDGLGFTNNKQMAAIVTGIEYLDGRYYVAGDFNRVDDLYVVNIAAWDYESGNWNLVDDGTGNKGIYDGTVFKIENDGNDIYAGGSFSIAGGTYTRNIAHWNGSGWEALGEGDENGINGSVFTILKHDNNVFAGGYFGKAGSSDAFHVAQWDGKKWNPLGIGVGGIQGAHVRDLALIGDYLYVAGYFSTVGDQSNYEISANSIARFNLNTRKWESPEKGVELSDGIPGIIYDIEVFGNKIAIAGSFKKAGGYNTLNFAMLEGDRFNNPGLSADVDGIVQAVEIVNNQILIGGHLVTDDSDQAYGMLKWTENGWEQICLEARLGVNEGQLFITDIEPFRDGFIAGGNFNFAGGKLLNNLAYFNGNEWFDVGGGTQSGVSDFVISDNSMFIAGPGIVSSQTSNGIGLVEFEFDEITATKDIPAGNKLLSNYPNPFKNHTVIDYVIKYPALVNLSVYDVSGKRIKTLVNEHKAEGMYHSTLYSENLDPGFYMCRISYGNEMQTLKILISE